MKKTEIITTAKAVAEGKMTAKAVAAEFKTLVAKYGKENAIKIQAAAKEIVSGKKANVTSQAAAAIDILKDGERVGAAAWKVVLADKNSRAFAIVVYQACNYDLAAMLAKYCSYTDKAGNVYGRDKDGNYKVKDLSKVGTYLAALKNAVRNAKRVALGAALGDVCKKID